MICTCTSDPQNLQFVKHEWVSEWACEWVSEGVSEGISWESEWVSDGMSEGVSEEVSEWGMEWGSEGQNEWVRDRMSERASEGWNEWVREWVSAVRFLGLFAVENCQYNDIHFKGYIFENSFDWGSWLWSIIHYIIIFITLQKNPKNKQTEKIS